MPVNANGTKHGLHAAVDPGIEEEMAAYDELPEAIRQEIGTFPLRASAVEIRDRLKAGASVAEALARFRINRAKIPMSFVPWQPKAKR